MKFLQRISTEHIGNWLYRELMLKRMISPLGLTLLALVAIGSGYLSAGNFYILPFLASAMIIGIVLVYICLFQPLKGFYITSTLGIFIFYPNHLVGRDAIPLSPVWEVLILITFLGSYLIGSKQLGNSGRLIKTPISLILIIYSFYMIIQVFNPNVDHLDAWISSIKRWFVFMLLYVTAYRVFDTPAKVKGFVKYWIIAFFIIGLYGCFQQWFGYLPMEMNYIMSIPGRFELLFQGGQLRKFSFLSDAATFGMQSGAMAVFIAVIALNTKEKKRKYMYFFFALICLVGSAYSGTRTANIIPPIGLALYGIMTIQNKTTVMAIFLGTLLGLFLLYAPIYSNATLNRVRTTFDKKDESLNLRERNRHYIQPYMYAHPMGGGFGTTNETGEQLFPDHPLAGFPTDSGLLRIGLELGWIGLTLWVLFNLCIMWQGIIYYFKIRNRDYKLYIVAMLTAIFPIIVCQYSQDSIGQLPGIIVILGSIAIFKRLLEFDEEESNRIYSI